MTCIRALEATIAALSRCCKSDVTRCVLILSNSFSGKTGLVRMSAKRASVRSRCLVNVTALPTDASVFARKLMDAPRNSSSSAI